MGGHRQIAPSGQICFAATALRHQTTVTVSSSQCQYETLAQQKRGLLKKIPKLFELLNPLHEKLGQGLYQMQLRACLCQKATGGAFESVGP